MGRLVWLCGWDGDLEGWSESEDEAVARTGTEAACGVVWSEADSGHRPQAKRDLRSQAIRGASGHRTGSTFGQAKGGALGKPMAVRQHLLVVRWPTARAHAAPRTPTGRDP